MVRFKTLHDKVLQKAKAKAKGGKSVEHPGYFWLAYHWKNLLPSCAFCNAHLGKKSIPNRSQSLPPHSAIRTRRTCVFESTAVS
jgi:hypothetical protein